MPRLPPVMAGLIPAIHTPPSRLAGLEGSSIRIQIMRTSRRGHKKQLDRWENVGPFPSLIAMPVSAENCMVLTTAPTAINNLTQNN